MVESLLKASFERFPGSTIHYKATLRVEVSIELLMLLIFVQIKESL